MVCTSSRSSRNCNSVPQFPTGVRWHDICLELPNHLDPLPEISIPFRRPASERSSKSLFRSQMPFDSHFLRMWRCETTAYHGISLIMYGVHNQHAKAAYNALFPSAMAFEAQQRRAAVPLDHIIDRTLAICSILSAMPSSHDCPRFLSEISMQ